MRPLLFEPFAERLGRYVYCVLDPACCLGREVTEVAAAALGGRIAVLQYRDKSSDMDRIETNARALQALCRQYGTPFVVNDHVEIAARIGADGVHIGQGDMDVKTARQWLGPEAIIGLTAFTPGHMAALDPAIVTYVGTGPVFPTRTDKGKPVLGMEGLAELIPLAPVPVVAIGGITPEHAPALLAAGASGVAVMRAVSEAGDPQAAAEAFHKKMNRSDVSA